MAEGRGRRWARALGVRLGAPLLRAWGASLRKEVVGWEAVAAARTRSPLIITFFHSRFLMLPFVYPHDRPVGVLISPSADGDVIAAVIEALGRRAIRGSSRRGGAEASRELEAALRRGWDVGIAVDGPLGPRYVVKPGAVRLAQKTGAPIVPLVYASRRGRALPTWDRFWLPAPGSRTRFLWGEPCHVEPEAEFEVARAALEARMRALLAEVERWAGRSGALP